VPLRDMAVLLMLAALLWLLPMLLSQSLAGAQAALVADVKLGGADAAILARAEALALDLSRPQR
jgi:hypothetical protein